jgi:hypothetical protein
VAAVRFWLAGSRSANTGVAPTTTTAPAVAKKLRGGTITSSPGPSPGARRASSSASVPLASATANVLPQAAANSRSKARPSLPVQ